MIRVASYCRVSTDSYDQANSFASQQRYFTEYIDRNSDWELYRVYADEGITGTSTKKRAAFNQMMEDAYSGKFQLILTKEVSRFSRNILDTIAYTRELRSLGVSVIFLNDGINTVDPDAESRLSIFATFAQEESRRTSGRVVWGQTRQMERGIVFGRSMLGYDVKDGVMSVNTQGAELIQQIFHKYAVVQMGTAQIAKYLNDNGYKTYTGGKWKSAGIIKILHNEKYVGDLVQKKTYTPDYLTHQKKCNRGEVPLIVKENHHEPIISRDLWELTQQRLRRNDKRNGSDNGHSNRYIFSGKIKCAQCGSSFVGRYKYHTDGSKYRRWSCGTATNEGTAACDVGRLVRDDDAIHMLQTAIRNLPMDRQRIAANVAELAAAGILAGNQISEDSPEQICRDIERILNKKEAMLDSYFCGDISKDEMVSLKSRYDHRMEALRLRLARAEESSGIDITSLKETLKQDVSALLSGEMQSEVLYKNLLDKLTVYKDKHVELRLAHLSQVFHFR